MDFERPEADAAEQSVPAEEALEEEEQSPEITAPETPPDANPADVAEQRRIVPDADGYDHD
jgi:hypothetical protein